MTIDLVERIMEWWTTHQTVTAPLGLGLLSLWLLWFNNRILRRAGALVAGIALLAAADGLFRPMSGTLVASLAMGFSSLAIAGAIVMLSERRPVYAALAFAMAVLAICGLFMLLSANFFAAATIIVYAGAIIVTFLFVIMLAQQSGLAEYDSHPKHPIGGSIIGFLMMAALLGALNQSIPTGSPSESRGSSAPLIAVPQAVAQRRSPLAQTADGHGRVIDLGRTLFGDYLWGVELAGAVLLSATIGAVAIAGQRREQAA